MIKEAFAQNKNFYLAKMQTRNNRQFTKSHSHFYNIYGILKLLFKKRNEEIVGRFHHKYIISVKNPITNAV